MKKLHKETFFEDLGIKLVALFLSLLVWFHATTEKKYTDIIELPVRYRYSLPDTLVLISIPPKKVRLRVNAKGKTILKLKYTKPFYEVNIGPLNRGKSTVDMSQGEISQEEGVKIVEVMPKKVNFIVDGYINRKIYSIIPRLKYDSLKMKVKIKRISPRVVLVRGPRTVLISLNHILTDTISLDTFKSGRYIIKTRPKINLKYVSILKPDTLSVEVIVTKFVFDTIEVSAQDGRKFTLYVLHPDTIKLTQDSVSCFTDSISGRPECRTSPYVVIQRIVEDK